MPVIRSHVQFLDKHQPPCEAVQEPIHYCCALWIYMGYEILKLHFTLRNKKKIIQNAS